MQGMLPQHRGEMMRRHFASAGFASLGLAPLLAQQADPPSGAVRPEPKRGARQDLELVKSFVIMAHSDANLDRIKELVGRDPKLVLASHDWGEGDWETGLGGASHVGSRKMAQY